MAGLAASLTTLGLDDALARLGRLPAFRMAELADDAGAVLESAARGRFDTATAPDGTPWPAWSEAYAATRGSHHGLLVGDGDLRDSIASHATGSEVRVGSALVYAAIHQLGGEEVGMAIPARAYLGLSDEDETDLRDLVTGRLEDLLR